MYQRARFLVTTLIIDCDADPMNMPVDECPHFI